MDKDNKQDTFSALKAFQVEDCSFHFCEKFNSILHQVVQNKEILTAKQFFVNSDGAKENSAVKLDLPSNTLLTGCYFNVEGDILFLTSKNKLFSLNLTEKQPKLNILFESSSPITAFKAHTKPNLYGLIVDSMFFLRSVKENSHKSIVNLKRWYLNRFGRNSVFYLSTFN